MAEAATQAAYMSLEDFLDTLPRQPCIPTPSNKYYCTVCERLNKGVAARCKSSRIFGKVDQVKMGEDKEIQFIKMLDEKEDEVKPETTERAVEKVERIEFKVVTPLKSDDEYPLIEFIQPKNKKVEPIEMELLENVAIEFEVSDDAPVEVEALEVVPLDETESGEFGSEEAFEVEAIEVEPVDDEDLGSDSGVSLVMEPLPEFKPISDQPAIQQEPKPILKLKPKKKVKKKVGLKQKPPTPAAIQPQVKAPSPPMQTTGYTQYTPSPQIQPRPQQTQPSAGVQRQIPPQQPQAQIQASKPHLKPQLKPQAQIQPQIPPKPVAQMQFMQPQSSSVGTKVKIKKQKKVKKVAKK